MKKRKPADAEEAAPGPRRVYRGLTLNAFQEEALHAIEAGKSVLLSAPTGAGKTLVAEYAIEETLKNGRRAIYTAPIKALSSQKYRDFKAQPSVDVGIMTGDVTINPTAPLLIMTTEIFRNTIFESPRDLTDVDYVVFDEIHYMDDLERGTVWEESIIFAPPHIRFICLSATVANLNQFGEWIEQTREQPVEIIRHTDRPVPLRHYFFFPGIGARRAEEVSRFPQFSRRRGYGPKHDVLDMLQQRDSMPVLFFCFSRKECERRARMNATRDLLDPADQARITQLFDQICDLFQVQADAYLEELRALAARGVSYHHAGLLPLHKELVERLFTSGMLRLLFTTETFALGINMPARSVVFSSLRKFDGVGFDYIKAREYQQMAGRAGRQGIDDEGLVYSIIDDPRIGDPEDVKRVVFGQIEPIRSRFNLSYSTLINLHRVLGTKIFEAWESSFNNFQWHGMPKKKRERNQQKQVDAIQRRLAVLREFEYLRGDEEVTEKGAFAAVINGFELPVAELFFSGLLDWLDEIQTLVVIASLVYEERRGEHFSRAKKKVLAEHVDDIRRVVQRIIDSEVSHGIAQTVRPPDFRISGVIQAYAGGAEFHELGHLTNASLGDLVRMFRLTVQLLRQIKKAARGKKAIAEKMDRAIALVNRDVVDAKRQLELG